MKYLYIELEVQDGERRHTHRCLHTTPGENINFAAQRYAYQFWGEPDGHNDEWWDLYDIAIRLRKVTELTKEEYELMRKIFY